MAAISTLFTTTLWAACRYRRERIHKATESLITEQPSEAADDDRQELAFERTFELSRHRCLRFLLPKERDHVVVRYLAKVIKELPDRVEIRRNL